jgi:hypothetical protein
LHRRASNESRNSAQAFHAGQAAVDVRSHHRVPIFCGACAQSLASGRLAYRIKTPWRDGTTQVTMSDAELLEKLAALVPAPRFHLVRYFGILASAAKQRPSIVPVPPPASGVEFCGHPDTSEKEKPQVRHSTWAPLMSRIFAVDLLACPRCGGRMRILADIEDPSVARKILDYLGLPSRPPPVAPARRNRHLEIAEW